MKPIRFIEQTCVYAENQKPYLPLPSFKHKDDWQCVSSVWGMSIKERVKVLFIGKIWVTMPTFGKPLTPLALSVNKPKFE